MTPVPRRQPGRPRHARRARVALVAGSATCALLIGALLFLRAAPREYTPGVEAATSDEITSALTRSIPPGAPRITFTDAAGEAGIAFSHFPAARSTQLPEDMGSGAAWGDYDGDGDPDLFLVNQSAPLRAPPTGRRAEPARSALYRNDGGVFWDVTRDSGIDAGGLGMAAAWGDYDGDRDLDLVMTRFGTNALYRNDGPRGFVEVTGPSGLGGLHGFWTGATWADYDRDGDPDLYICGYVRYTLDPESDRRTSLQYGAVIPYTLNPSSYPPERNLLYRNDRGVFREVAAAAGVDNPTGRSLSAAWADFDNDGWQDLYVANDISDNAMYWNRGDGTFADVSHAAWVADYRGAMGLGIGDWENDGDLDIFVTHWIAQENALYENLLEKMPPAPGEPMHFIDKADMLGLGQISLDVIGWGTAFVDYDNDGRLDLLAVNGSTFQTEDDPPRLMPMKNQLFWNAGVDGFYEMGAVAGDDFSGENVGRGAAFADYDADGDVDALVVVNGGSARLLRNDGGNAKGWLRLLLRGPRPARAERRARAGRHTTSTFANGARIRLTAGGVTQIREVGAGSSYLSQDPPGEVRFGLGDAARVDRLEVYWPDGTTQIVEDLPADVTVTLVEGEAPAIANEAPRRGSS